MYKSQEGFGTGRKLLVALIVAIFGGFYSALADLSQMLPIEASTPRAQMALRLGTLAVVVVALFILSSFGFWLKSRYDNLIVQQMGFRSTSATWLPKPMDRRIEVARRHFFELLRGSDRSLIIATVSAEWDLLKPFNEKELRSFGRDRKLACRILLAHPESEALRRRCEREHEQDFPIVKRRIVKNSQLLLGLAPDINCEVRWYLDAPKFHILGSESGMFFSPFVDGKPGHDTRRYFLEAGSDMFQSFSQWFEDAWEHALDAKLELRWAERSVEHWRAVFLDRDDTLIKDICYAGEVENVPIEILPGVIEGLRRLSENGFRLIVVSNQQPVGLKLTRKTELNQLTKRIKDSFAEHRVYFDAFYYCTHNEADACNCRKPGTLLFETAAKDFALKLDTCFFIGDSDKDRGVGEGLKNLPVLLVGPDKTFAQAVSELLGG